jgi:F0F1-type ATP synthase assembly protein I
VDVLEKWTGAVPLGPPNSKELRFYLALAQVGTEMVGPMLLGLLLDYAFGWLPWATVIGLIVGAIGSMTHMITMLQRRDREERQSKSEERHSG